MFNPAGAIDCNWYIHFVSFCEMDFFIFHICAPPVPQKVNFEGSLLWNLLKWFDKLCLRNPFLVLLICSQSLTFSSLVVLPTYCKPHLHSKGYVTCVVPHMMNFTISYTCPVVLNWKCAVFLFPLLHVLHVRHLPHLKTPVWSK